MRLYTREVKINPLRIYWFTLQFDFWIEPTDLQQRFKEVTLHWIYNCFLIVTGFLKVLHTPGDTEMSSIGCSLKEKNIIQNRTRWGGLIFCVWTRHYLIQAWKCLKVLCEILTLSRVNLRKYFSTLLCMLSHFSHVWLFATLWTVSHQAPLSMGILQARILQWVAISFSRGSSQSRDWSGSLSLLMLLLSCFSRVWLYATP